MLWVTDNLPHTHMLTCPNDDEIRNEFTRVVTTIRACWLECKLTRMMGKKVCGTTWRPVKSLPRHAEEEQLKAARQELLENPTFFRICKHCGKRIPVGNDCYATCAEHELAVIH